MQLMRRHAFLAGVHQVKGQNPFVQRDMAALHDGADRHGEMVAAGVALKQARTVRFAFKALIVARVGIAAMWAKRAIRPAEAF